MKKKNWTREEKKGGRGGKRKTKREDKRREKRRQTREDKNKTIGQEKIKQKLLTRGRDPDARSFMVKVKLNFLF